MHADMSQNDMAAFFAFIVKGSRVLDLQMIDFAKALRMDYRRVERNCVFSQSEVKYCVGSAKYDAWFASRHRKKMTFLTLEDALKFVANRARELERFDSLDPDIHGFEHFPNIFTKEDIDELLENEIKKIEREYDEIRRHFEYRFHTNSKGQIVLLDPPPQPPLPIETHEERLEDAIRKRDGARKRLESLRGEALEKRRKLREAEAAATAAQTDPGPS